MISLYRTGSTWLHRQAAGHKLIALCLISAVSYKFSTMLPILVLALTTALLYASLGQRGLLEMRVVKPLWPWLLMMFVFHWLSGDPLLGLLVVSKMVVLVLLANLLTLSTRQSDLLAALEYGLRPLSWLGVSSRPFALAVSMMISYLPVLLHLFEQQRQAWIARGGGRRGRWKLVAPAMISALKLADHAGEALAARGGVRGLR